jgi:hypothetical protein
MDQILLELLCDLERIGQSHEELYDSEVREQMGNAVMAAFVRQTPGYVFPDQFGMFSEAANAEVRKALASYVDRAIALAAQAMLRTFHDRLRAFQDRSVRTSSAVPVDYEDLFGHTPPEWYDDGGNVLWDRVR